MQLDEQANFWLQLSTGSAAIVIEYMIGDMDATK